MCGSLDRLPPLRAWPRPGSWIGRLLGRSVGPSLRGSAVLQRVPQDFAENPSTERGSFVAWNEETSKDSPEVLSGGSSLRCISRRQRAKARVPYVGYCSDPRSAGSR